MEEIEALQDSGEAPDIEAMRRLLQVFNDERNQQASRSAWIRSRWRWLIVSALVAAALLSEGWETALLFVIGGVVLAFLDFAYFKPHVEARFPACSIERYNQHQRAAEALIPMLKAIEPGGVSRFDVPLRNDLYRALRICADLSSPCYSPRMAVTLLEAIAKIGDAQAMQEVAYVAHVSATDAQDARICAAAQSCLMELENKMRRKLPGDTLLRPAAPPDFAAETLLRPVRNVITTPPEQLLRPVQDDVSRE